MGDCRVPDWAKRGSKWLVEKRKNEEEGRGKGETEEMEEERKK